MKTLDKIAEGEVEANQALTQERDQAIAQRDARPNITLTALADLRSEKQVLTEANESITKRLINELGLGISENKSLEQVIEILKVLLDKKPIENLRDELAKSNDIIKDLNQKLTVEKEAHVDYLQIKQKLSQVQQNNNNLINERKIERTILVSSLAISLVIIGFLMKKLKKNSIDN
ncbi:MAG: hypothetical protein mread185_000596 [Mycoplasmataceae bacterium]|nr:MAG: hypothetical protein mread185_000596 [Mycoplasmataceae bacterium]